MILRHSASLFQQRSAQDLHSHSIHTLARHRPHMPAIYSISYSQLGRPRRPIELSSASSMVQSGTQRSKHSGPLLKLSKSRHRANLPCRLASGTRALGCPGGGKLCRLCGKPATARCGERGTFGSRLIIKCMEGPEWLIFRCTYTDHVSRVSSDQGAGENGVREESARLVSSSV